MLRSSLLQNIIKKVNGQKFVYRFVSYPDILKGDAATRTDNGDLAAGGFTPTSRRGDSTLLEGESDDRSKVGGGAPGVGAGIKQSNRNDYIHSGLYTSFHLNSLQNKHQLFRSIKIENPAEKLVEKRGPTAPPQSQETPPQPQPPTALPSVIKFGNSPPKPAPTAPPRVVLEPTLTHCSLDSLQGPPLRAEDVGTHSSQQHPSVYPSEHTRPSEPVFTLSDLSSASPSPNLLPESSQDFSVHSDVETRSSEPSASQAQEAADTQTQDKVSTRAHAP